MTSQKPLSCYDTAVAQHKTDEPSPMPVNNNPSPQKFFEEMHSAFYRFQPLQLPFLIEARWPSHPPCLGLDPAIDRNIATIQKPPNRSPSDTVS